MFVYDITRYESFENIKKWINLVEKCDSVDHTLDYILIGNKSDLFQDRAVTMEDARAMADRHSMLFMETSAHGGDGVHAAFKLIGAEIHRKDLCRSLNSRSLDLKNNNLHRKAMNDSIKLSKTPPGISKCCE